MAGSLEFISWTSEERVFWKSESMWLMSEVNAVLIRIVPQTGKSVLPQEVGIGIAM